MALDDPEARTRETLAAGLVKGQTACNRSACQTPLIIGKRWWNVSTRQFYCNTCAKKINQMAMVCTTEATMHDNPEMIMEPAFKIEIYDKKTI